MPEHTLTQIEDRLVTILTAAPSITGRTIKVAESLDIALDDSEVPALIVLTSAYSFDIADENNTTHHTADIEIEAISAQAPTGTISRTNRNVLARVMAIIAADRRIGLGIHDIQEDDIAPITPRGKDLDSASLKFRVEWFTPRGDWFSFSSNYA